MNNEPVAWMSNGKEFYVQKNYCPDFIPLYTHPVKELTPLTEDECRAIIEKHNWFAKSWAEMAMEIQDAILRKAQNG
jgi:hypothetical protein